MASRALEHHSSICTEIDDFLNKFLVTHSSMLQDLVINQLCQIGSIYINIKMTNKNDVQFIRD